DGTMPLLVTAPEPRLVAETEALVRALGAIGLSIQGIVVNRALARATFGRGAPDPGLPDGVSGALAARLAASYGELRALGAREEAVDLHVQVDEASLDRLELGEQADHVGARGHVQEAEHGLHVAVDAALGLEGLLQGGRERLREARVREQLLREPAEPLLAEAEQALQDVRVVGLHPAPAL